VRGQRCLYGRFAEKKVKFVSENILALFSKKYVFQCIVLGAESVLTAPNNVLSEKFTVLFLSFLQQLKAKNLSPNHHA